MCWERGDNNSDAAGKMIYITYLDAPISDVLATSVNILKPSYKDCKYRKIVVTCVAVNNIVRTGSM